LGTRATAQHLHLSAPCPPLCPHSELPQTNGLLPPRCRGVCGKLGPSRWGGGHQGTPNPLPSLPFSGLRSYPLRGSHSLDDLLDRPSNSTAAPEYWDGQSHSRTPSHIPNRAPSPAPTPLPGSRQSSMEGASNVKVSQGPVLSPGQGSGDHVATGYPLSPCGGKGSVPGLQLRTWLGPCSRQGVGGSRWGSRQGTSLWGSYTGETQV
jgi:hypothetical protein